MVTIYKYPLHVKEVQLVRLPKGASILTVQMQSGVPQLWALVDTEENEIEVVKIITCGTGNRMPKVTQMIYINTIQMMGGDFVYHIFREV